MRKTAIIFVVLLCFAGALRLSQFMRANYAPFLFREQ